MKNTVFFTKSEQRELLEEIEALEDGKQYKATFEEAGDMRTIQQNKWFHKVCTIVGNELGYSMEDIKDLFKTNFLTKKKYVKINGRRKQIAKVVGTSELRKKEFAELFDKIKVFTDSMNIKIPSPESYNIALYYESQM